MYDESVRRQAAMLIAQGMSLAATSRQLGIARATLKDWRDNPNRVGRPARPNECPRCNADRFELDEAKYSYLLGLYLGDVASDRWPKACTRSHRLADAWPGLLEECRAVIQAVRPSGKVYLVQSVGCVYVMGLWKHWPCLFPQHGPGRKHHRSMRLEPWQQEIVDRYPGELLRGLFHSDGCRSLNVIRRQSGDEVKTYAYPRYFFVNHSRDILWLCGKTLDFLDIAWRYSKPNTISVARRDAVAALDTFVGPKF